MVKTKPIFDQHDDRKLSDKSGKLIAQMRREIGLSQKSLAISMGINNSYLCDLEKGNRIWRVSLWNKAVKVINEVAKGNGK